MAVMDTQLMSCDYASEFRGFLKYSGLKLIKDMFMEKENSSVLASGDIYGESLREVKE